LRHPSNINLTHTGKARKKGIMKTNNKNYSLDFLNNCIKSGKIIIDQTTIFAQDFHTFDNKIIVKSKRVGGGFTIGTTLHELTINHATTIASLDKIYEITEKYLRGVKS
jgi:hypothetical protein